MEIQDLEALCLEMAPALAGEALESEMQALAKDLAWARTKVYVRKPAGRERLAQIEDAARKLHMALREAGTAEQVRSAFAELDEAIRRLRIEIARDTQVAT